VQWLSDIRLAALSSDSKRSEQDPLRSLGELLDSCRAAFSHDTGRVLRASAIFVRSALASCCHICQHVVNSSSALGQAACRFLTIYGLSGLNRPRLPLPPGA
jgi:hypothetical protein